MELRQSPSWLVGTELGVVKEGFPNKKLSWVQADTSQALPLCTQCGPQSVPLRLRFPDTVPDLRRTRNTRAVWSRQSAAAGEGMNRAQGQRTRTLCQSHRKQHLVPRAERLSCRFSGVTLRLRGSGTRPNLTCSNWEIHWDLGFDLLMSMCVLFSLKTSTGSHRLLSAVKVVTIG